LAICFGGKKRETSCGPQSERIIARFGEFFSRDAYVQSYLGPNGASSKDDFMYLLDELNAYSHDLDAAVALVPLQLRDREVDHRDGLAALMYFCHALRGYGAEDAAGDLARAAAFGTEKGDPNIVEPGRDGTRFILRASGVRAPRPRLHRQSVRKEERWRAHRASRACPGLPGGLPGARDDVVHVIKFIALSNGDVMSSAQHCFGSTDVSSSRE
jgi:hypothetical protein